MLSYRPQIWCSAGVILASSFLSALAQSAVTASQIPASLAKEATLAVLPMPAHVTARTGQFVFDRGFDVVFSGYQEPRLERARLRFLQHFRRKTGMLQWPQAAGLPQIVVETKSSSAAVQQVSEDESYRIDVTPVKIVLTAAKPIGALRGLQTILQLIHTTPQGYEIAAMQIEDRPRFPWRGLMIDSGRHFITPNVIRQTLDGMELVKMNVLHWHLADDQGFRVESKVFSRLQGMGSDGQFYTQEEVRSIVAYARDRGIRVMPEFEMPSHASSWFVGYPELGDSKGPYRLKHALGQSWERPRDAAEDSSMDPTQESTYKFLDRFLGEMSSLFPDVYFHIGGDAEDAMIEWKTNPLMKQYMDAHGMKDPAELQTYFDRRVEKLIVKHGKRMMGWDEVLQPDTPKSVAIQSWRGLDSLAKSAGSGHPAVLSWGYYLDLNEPASRHYAVDPLADAAAALPEAQRAHILGGEAAMWSEYVTAETLGGRLWPRAAAVAERLWSLREVSNSAAMYTRLNTIAQELTYAGVPYLAARASAYDRLTTSVPAAALKVLASVVEPPRGYPRGGSKTYDSYSPLNRLSDVVPAESDLGREFCAVAARIAARTASAAEVKQAQAWLAQWRDNDALLAPGLGQSALTVELTPLSKNLSRVAVIGLAALERMNHSGASAADTETFKKDQLAALKIASAQTAELNLAITPGVAALVSAIEQ